MCRSSANPNEIFRAKPPLDKRDDESLGWGYWDRIWPSSVAFSEYLIRQYFPNKLKGYKVLEIGCGTGVPGMVAAQMGASTMFSDLVPVTLEGVKETCRLNHITNFDTCTLDWSEKVECKEHYDVVLGSEVFYDDAILPDIAQFLKLVLAQGGKGIFCDPNRLGFDALEHAFHQHFVLSITPIPLNWPACKKGPPRKEVYVYELTPRFDAQ